MLSFRRLSWLLAWVLTGLVLQPVLFFGVQLAESRVIIAGETSLGAKGLGLLLICLFSSPDGCDLSRRGLKILREIYCSIA